MIKKQAVVKRQFRGAIAPYYFVALFKVNE
jgi:hypothetical protein